MKLIRIVGAIFLNSTLLLGVTHIGGDISSIVLTPSGSPYIVDKNITIPSNKVVTIEPGCIFLFKPFTFFQVNGRLEVHGNISQQTVFTSIYDHEFSNNSEKNPESFDWNGIEITDSCSGVILNNVLISYSVFGLKSQTEAISIKSSSFHSNGQYNFTIFEKLVEVTEEMPFSWNPTPEVTSFTKNSIEHRLHGLVDRILLNLPLRKKPSVAVSPFVPMENERGKPGRTIAEYLVGILIKNPNIILVEQMAMQKTLKEISTDNRNLSIDQQAQYMGEALNAEYIITGSITEYENTTVNIRCIEVKTSRIVSAISTTLDHEKLQEFSNVFLGEQLKVSSSIFRSALIPGWGQIYSEKPVRGGISLGLYLLGGAFTVYSGVKTAKASADFSDFNSMLTTNSGTKSLQNEFIASGGIATDQNAFNTFLNNKRSSLDTRRNEERDKLYVSIGITGVIWGLNLIDAAIAGKQNKNKIKLYFSGSQKDGVAVKAGIPL